MAAIATSQAAAANSAAAAAELTACRIEIRAFQNAPGIAPDQYRALSRCIDRVYPAPTDNAHAILALKYMIVYIAICTIVGAFRSRNKYCKGEGAFDGFMFGIFSIVAAGVVAFLVLG
jgi:hypothetical protein